MGVAWPNCLTHFRTRIWATDYFPVDRPAHVERLLPPEQLDEVLAVCDILILCVPLTDLTRGMIDARALAAMKPGAVLINVARGPVVVEAALVAALESGHLSGAGLDVTEVEPLPPTSRLWELAQRDDHATRRCAVAHALRRRHRPVLRESATVFCTAEPMLQCDRQSAGLSAAR